VKKVEKKVEKKVVQKVGKKSGKKSRKMSGKKSGKKSRKVSGKKIGRKFCMALTGLRTKPMNSNRARMIGIFCCGHVAMSKCGRVFLIWKGQFYFSGDGVGNFFSDQLFLVAKTFV